jgi:hypothetical protein
VCQVPTSLAGLLSLLAPCFTQPSFQTFSGLLVGFVGRVRDCTITGMLQAGGLAGVWHHSRAHDFFARARWDPDQLGLRLLDFLVEVFVAAGAPIRLAVDDTLFGRAGRRVWGAHYLHDGAQPEVVMSADPVGQLLGRRCARRDAAVPRRATDRVADPVPPLRAQG